MKASKIVERRKDVSKRKHSGYWEENQFLFMEHLAKELNIKTMDDWYKVQNKDIEEKGGATLRCKYGSKMKLLEAMFPNHRWEFWKFEKVPKGHWNLIQNQRVFMDWLGKELGVKVLEDWYKIKAKEIEIKAAGLLQIHGSRIKVLKAVYPEHDWNPWKFESTAMMIGFTASKEKQREFLDWIGRELGIKSPEDWYSKSPFDIIQKGGGTLLDIYGSLNKMLQSIYMDHRWSASKFDHIQEEFWKVKENQRTFMDFLGKELGFNKMDDWYSVNSMDFVYRGGRCLLDNYNWSPLKVLQEIYPECFWSAQQFDEIAIGTKEKQREFMDWLAKEIGIHKLEDWYKIKTQDFINKGGRSLLNYYDRSPAKVLQTLFPEHKWLLWMFETSPKGQPMIPTNKEQISLFINWLGKELKIRHLDDWYHVSIADLRNVVSTDSFKDFPLDKMLEQVYPDQNWDIGKLRFKGAGVLRASQRRLAVAVAESFPQSGLYGEDFYSYILDSMENHLLKLEPSGKCIELDVYLPREQLAFEYQGEQHYYDIYALGPKWYQKQRDEEKRTACLENGITLIEIPYWWNFLTPSLLATVNVYRPDLIPIAEEGQQIPVQPPQGFPQGISSLIFLINKENLQLLMHGEDWDGTQDLTGWWVFDITHFFTFIQALVILILSRWMSEKMDGFRAYWDGSSLNSRQSTKFKCPTWFIDSLPKSLQLDGELWIGRGAFEKLVGLLNSSDYLRSNWKDLKYMIFDVPGLDLPYESRMEQLRQISLPLHAVIVESIECKGNHHLIKHLEEIVINAGEGVMVVKPKSLYESGRTNVLLKVKAQSECEVQVTEVVSNGLYCQQTDGKEVVVGCPAQILHDPPTLGSVITVKYKGFYQNGALRHPFFWRLRPDVLWNDICQQTKTLTNSNAIWTNPNNCTKFFDHLKKELKFKSLEEFYSLSSEKVVEFGGKALLEKMFDGSLEKALEYAYPDHKWLPWKFPRVPPGFWKEEKNQQVFMDWVFSELQFRKMEDWYTLSRVDFVDKGGSSLLRRFDSRLDLLKAVYPSHQWSMKQFSLPFW